MIFLLTIILSFKCGVKAGKDFKKYKKKRRMRRVKEITTKRIIEFNRNNDIMKYAN